MNRVVVTGMGAITPLGNDVPSFWEGLVAGRSGIGPLTKFDAAGFKAKVAAQVRDFDPEQYLNKNEVKKTDPFCQYALAAACQAMADSGIEGTLSSDRLGVYFGSGIGGLVTMSDELQKLIEKGPRKVSPFFVPMMISNIAAGNIAIRFHANGPCISVTTACATGGNAVGEAFRAIRSGYADAIIAGGAEAAITPLCVAGFSNCMALSFEEDPQAASIPFDRRRSGFVIGEGAGALILENYEHARARGAKIYAEVSGYGSTCDAYHITAPSPEAEFAAKSISDAIAEAGRQDESRIYYNAHGTGTPLNDKSETLAVKQALGDKAGTALLSSTKSMTGHMLGAAGAVECIAAVLALKNGIAPPTIGLLEPDPDCDLDYVPNKARKADIHLALSASFGFGGHNACIAFTKTEENA